MIYLALGSNIGNRFENLRTAISKLSEFFTCEKLSIVTETEALLLPDSPSDWNMPFLNMAICGHTDFYPFALLDRLKIVEKEMGRDLNAPKWSPRVIDIDIVAHGDEITNTEWLTIPHKEIKNRDFWQYLLTDLDYKIPEDIKLDIDNYKALNYFVLNPKLVGIVNVTPDSFSDGGKYLNPEAAVAQINKLRNEGACVVELGAQSTRPGYVEISPAEEIARLAPILERIDNTDGIGIDTYFDEVAEYAIKKYNIRWINDQTFMRARLSDKVLKLIADSGARYATMLHGMDVSLLESRANYLRNLGIKKENILLDPGIGFGKSKRDNINMIKNISRIKDIGYQVLFGCSRKSFISSFSNVQTADRDIETLAISDFAAAQKIDYIRVHNVRDHMRFFVAKCYATG
ncbi:MAG: dihydropteroate synthase [Holosporaceae bacterium]|jgi:2-amino-4-hydroxy-6-hydroxymethyldihydropteridine diphosphokinase/dihydropteroate synthase|nr:dihydropteroate synthase [Holosporaceae bacterium]